MSALIEQPQPTEPAAERVEPHAELWRDPASGRLLVYVNRPADGRDQFTVDEAHALMLDLAKVNAHAETLGEGVSRR